LIVSTSMPETGAPPVAEIEMPDITAAPSVAEIGVPAPVAVIEMPETVAPLFVAAPLQERNAGI